MLKWLRAAYIAMDLMTRFVIVPLALASLLTGIVQALGTPWGLFRHYWVVFKLLLTVVAVIVLLLQPARIGYLAGVAAQAALSSTDLRFLRSSLMIHAAVGLVVLLVIAGLGVYKPRGMTLYGRRKQHEQRALESDTGGDPGSSTITPRWVKVFAALFVVLLLLVGIMMLGGGHGPGAHVPSAG
jgi:putative copper export protein